jgi:glycosyltransferase involved in cell wall biosynthesis
MRNLNSIPKISVIIPSLNQEKYLRQAIESVISQNYPNLELFIFDGQSQDQSVEVIKEYENYIHTWKSEPDNGQSDAINKGFKQATGNLVAWLNADDYYLPNTFSELALSYSANPQAPFHFGNGLRVDKNGKTISKFCPTDALLFDRQALVIGLNYILQPSTFINRTALETVGYLDPNLHYGMDSDLWIRLSSVGKPVAINKTLSASREYETTKTSTGSFERVEELRRIGMKYSGLSITPGAICYFLDTLYRYTQENSDIYPSSYSRAIVSFWQQTSALFPAFEARPDGFPDKSRRPRHLKK